MTADLLPAMNPGAPLQPSVLVIPPNLPVLNTAWGAGATRECVATRIEEYWDDVRQALFGSGLFLDGVAREIALLRHAVTHLDANQRNSYTLHLEIRARQLQINQILAQIMTRIACLQLLSKSSTIAGEYGGPLDNSLRERMQLISNEAAARHQALSERKREVEAPLLQLTQTVKFRLEAPNPEGTRQN